MLQFAGMQQSDKIAFQNLVWDYYAAHGRHELPWRKAEHNGNFDPYKILISEFMLQQTQVARVIPKYLAFLEAYPSFKALAAAPLSGVLMLWSGLGYNRRAKFLWQTAQIVEQKYDGELPRSKTDLVALPGIGPNTAAAISVYAYNQTEVFIETNVRSVLLYHFFKGQNAVLDRALLPVMRNTIPAGKARTWYWGLMDYGTHLKQTVGNTARASAHYSKQSAFTGSRRQLRGGVVRALTAGPRSYNQLAADMDGVRLKSVLDDLMREGLVEENHSYYQLRS